MVIQRIFGAGLALQSLTGLVQAPQAVKHLQAVITELDTTIEELRTAIYDLHHLPEEQTGLRTRLHDLTSHAAENLGFTPSVTFDGQADIDVPDETVIHLIAVIREALTNIRRHAHATAADIHLHVGTELILQITDNGRGLGQTTRSSGLANLRQRALQLGGTFEVTSKPGAGTRLEWRVPLAP
jgi:signal transduction histidine kinase